MKLLRSVRQGILLVGFAALAVTACSSGSDDATTDESDDQTAAQTAESSTTTTEAPTTTTAAAELPVMTGFCADLPLTEVVALFEEAAVEETVANANPDACAVELRSGSGETITSFSIGVDPEVGSDGFAEAQDELFAANRQIEEETDSVSRPFREAFLLGDQAEIITGAISQLSILDGDRVWYVQQTEGDEALQLEQFVAIGQLVLDNAPTP